jgi:pimeloyl-ACP methyl ester carboxylesterase
MLQLHDVTVRGARSAVFQRGPRDATEAVVCVHGNPGPKDDFVPLLTGLDPRIRAIAPDMPGYGLADRLPDFDYTVAGYARHLDGLLEALRIERAHLVLHDFGGGWGLRWAADHPGRVGSITLIGIGVMEGYRWHRFARVWQTPVLGELVQRVTPALVFERALNADNPKPFPEHFLRRLALFAGDRGHQRAVRRLYRATKDPEELSARFREITGGTLDVPTLVLWGEDDPYVPAAYAEAQKRYFPQADVHVLPGCGHWPFVDDPEAVWGLAIPFLEARVGNSDMLG